MKNIVTIWNWTEKLLVGILALIATGLAFTGVIMRYGFRYSPEWLEEVTVFLLIWSTFIIASTLVEEKRHVGATFLVERLPPKLRRWVEGVTTLLALIFCIIVTYWGYVIVHISYITDESTTTGLNSPLWIIYLSIPIGLTLVSVRYCRQIYRLLFDYDPCEFQAHSQEGCTVSKQKDNSPISQD